MLAALPAGRPGGTLLDRSVRNITGSFAVKRRSFTSLNDERKRLARTRGLGGEKRQGLSQYFLPAIALLQTRAQ